MKILKQTLKGIKLRGFNWDSISGSYKKIQSLPIQQKAELAHKLYSNGRPVKEIAKYMKLSESRIYEYIRKENYDEFDVWMNKLLDNNGSTDI